MERVTQRQAFVAASLQLESVHVWISKGLDWGQLPFV